MLRLNSHWKMMFSDDHIIFYQNIVSRWHNHCHNWIPMHKWCITHIDTYTIKKLPNMVSLITTWTLPLDSHWKTGPEHISYVLMANDDHILKKWQHYFSLYNIWKMVQSIKKLPKMVSSNMKCSHQIHIEKLVLNIYNMSYIG